MSKREIIENLYKAGKITFEEAITLASVPSEEPLVTFKDGVIEDPIVEQQNAREETISEFIKQIVDEYYDEEYDPDENLAFDSAHCVKAMNDCGWRWFHCKTDQITVEEFKEELRHIVRDVIDTAIGKYKKNPDDEDGCFTCIETGGIRVEGWIDECDGHILVIKPMFILEQSEFNLNSDKLKKLL